ncbi:MAG: C40 family peptidase, partial [bacterium]
GATGPNAFDCSGLVQWAFKKVGVNLPRTADMQFRVGRTVSKYQLQPGDLIFFANTYCPGISHVGIYIGGGRFVHAANSRKGVIVSSLSESYWAQHYAGAKRV